MRPKSLRVSAVKILTAIKGKLIVSCQATKGDPLDDLDTLCRLTTAVLRGGAAGLRAEGRQCLSAFRKLTPLPIIGLVKMPDSSGEPHITPSFAAAKVASDAGADVIAVDCTRRRLSEPEPWPTFIPRIRAELERGVCADIASLEDAVLAQTAGVDMIATTLRGYTSDTQGIRWVDWPFLTELLSTVRVPVILEGYVTSPDEVRRALSLGIHAVVVGSAITRPQSITERFVNATILT